MKNEIVWVSTTPFRQSCTPLPPCHGSSLSLNYSRSISAVTVMGICEPHGLIKKLQDLQRKSVAVEMDVSFLFVLLGSVLNVKV